MDPAVVAIEKPVVVEKTEEKKELAHDANTGEATSQTKLSGSIEASQKTMDGVKHTLTAGLDSHEGSLLTPENVQGFEDNKALAIYKMEHADGREEKFHVGGLEEGVMHFDKDGLTVGANGIGRVGAEQMAADGSKRGGSVSGIASGGAHFDSKGDGSAFIASDGHAKMH